MEDIGTQLINVESMQQTIGEQVRKFENNGDETTVLQLRSLLPKLAGLQSSLRKSFNVYAQPGVRKIHIFNLPDELLVKIFEDVGSDFNSKRGEFLGVKDIKSLRLTCRRFCDTSSHLLIRRLDVSLTNQSLNHLDEVSRHPTISKGIRSLRIFAGLFKPLRATDLREFILQVLGILGEDYMNDLETMHDYFDQFYAADTLDDSNLLGLRDHNHLSELIRGLGTRNDIMLSCTRYLLDETILGYEDRNLATLGQVYSEYSELCRGQKMLLRNGVFFAGVAQAVARLPPGPRMTITDCEGPELRTLSNEIFNETYANVRARLLEPSKWTPEMNSLLSDQPLKLLYNLPNAIARAGNPLTELRISLDPSSGFNMGLRGEKAKDLASAAEHLKVLEIQCYLKVRTPEEQVNYSDFFYLLARGTNLRSVSFALGSPPEDAAFNPGPLLALLPWVKLREIRLTNVSIHCEEFSKLLRKLAPGTHITLERVYLQSGFWVDLLDVLRAKANCDSEVIEGWGNEDEVSGADDFSKVVGTYSSTPNPATKYIRGELSDNPLRSHPAQENADQDGMDQDDVDGTI